MKLIDINFHFIMYKSVSSPDKIIVIEKSIKKRPGPKPTSTKKPAEAKKKAAPNLFRTIT